MNSAREEAEHQRNIIFRLGRVLKMSVTRDSCSFRLRCVRVSRSGLEEGDSARCTVNKHVS